MLGHQGLLRLCQDHVADRFDSLRAERASGLPQMLHSSGPTWRAWAPDGIIAVFHESKKASREAKERQRNTSQPYPFLLTADASTRVAIRLDDAPFNFFSSNRVEGMVGFGVGANSSFTLWQHVQAFASRSSRQSVYVVPLAFVLSIAPSQTPDDLILRLDGLIDHTVEVWGELVQGELDRASAA